MLAIALVLQMSWSWPFLQLLEVFLNCEDHLLNVLSLHFRGEKNNKKDPFRKWCGAVGAMRSLLPQGIPVVALTATASADTRKRILQMLSLNKSVQIVVSPNRENIKIYLQKVTNDISLNFYGL